MRLANRILKHNWRHEVEQSSVEINRRICTARVERWI